MDISVIMPSFLGNYKGCASNQIEKFHRAVGSFQTQKLGQYQSELIIISDGCKLTNQLYNSHYKEDSNVKLCSSDKQDLFSGNIRQQGIDIAKGKYISFLDTDDMFLPQHLYSILSQFLDNDWCYWDDYTISPTSGGNNIRPTVLDKGKCGTSTIAYKKSLPVSWNGKNGYGHDYEFICELKEKSDNFEKIYNTSYICCHVPGYIDL